MLNSDHVIEEGKVRLPLNSSLWTSITEPIECKLLKPGFSEWKSGKLKTKSTVDLCPKEAKRFSSESMDYPIYSSVEVELLFYPDEPENIESPLDDIRQSESYKKLL